MRVSKESDGFTLRSSKTGAVLGHHASREEAEAHQRYAEGEIAKAQQEERRAKIHGRKPLHSEDIPPEAGQRPQ